MKPTNVLCILVSLLLPISSFCQGGNPWNNPLKIAWSSNGTTFNIPRIFQDSAGVPSIIKWKGDTLIAAFQWFRLPKSSLSWDRVATKFSYDNGITWTQPTPIIVNGLPTNYQRPFDPTLAIFGNNSIRMYFSSSNGLPIGGLDSTVNTYSANSTDGINFSFESNPRVDVLSKQVIDPAVIYFNTGWHYLSPIGSPQQGAYHYVSPDGLNFNAVANIPSDNNHNWTGNYMIESSTELRFYGSGPNIWYNSSPNGGVWSGYVNTNILGGDPSVLKISSNNYVMVYVGQPYSTGISDIVSDVTGIHAFPNPVSSHINILAEAAFIGSAYTMYDNIGKVVLTGKVDAENTTIDVGNVSVGMYLLSVGENMKRTFKVIIE